MWKSTRKIKNIGYQESSAEYYNGPTKQAEVETYSCQQENPIISSFDVEPQENNQRIITNIKHQIKGTDSTHAELAKSVRRATYTPTVENSINFVKELLAVKLISHELALELAKKIDIKNIEQHKKEFLPDSDPKPAPSGNCKIL